MSLRKALEYLTTLRCSWTAEEAALLANCEIAPTKAFLVLMARNGVVLKSDDRYRSGPEAKAWRSIRPKTRPGGHGKAYRRVKSLRAELSARDWQEGRSQNPPNVDLLTRQKGQTEDTSGQAMALGGDTEDNLAPLFTVNEAAALLAVSTRTLHRWRDAGRIRMIQLSPTIFRISSREIKRISSQGLDP